MSNMVDISDLSKASVLAVLFNASAPAGMGFLQAANVPNVMTVEYAEELITHGNGITPDYGGFQIPGRDELAFDYLYGRPLKVNLTEDLFDPAGFDRNNGGAGTAQRLIDELRATDDIVTPATIESNAALTHLNAHVAMEMANVPTVFDGNVVTLGGAEDGAALVGAVDKQMMRL